ncbi:hypothetical protein BS78_04G140900 [Paspalum vaginatum]|nr:hypothetical protein BS78_04G140900 [Paspalum vaginatum]
MLTPLFSAAMDPQRGERELQLLLTPTTITPLDGATLHAPRPPASSPSDQPQLDLSLSISIGPPTTAQAAEAAGAAADHHQQSKKVAAADVEALKRQTAEQARMASAERAYAERVMELARRELELAEREFARARAIWERARGEVEKVERVKAMAARRIAAGSAAAALEITCHACMQRFHP